jgi:hypothetical protein
MSASLNDAARLVEPPVRDARFGNEFAILEQQVRLGRIFLIGTIAGIALAHGIVLYKIDTGVRSSAVRPVEAARAHRAFW